MTSRTHDLAALTALNVIVVTQALPDVSLSTALVSLGICYMGGLAPDIDNKTAEFWHKLPAGTILGRILHHFFGGHRLISHSILGLVFLGWVTKYLLDLAGHTLLTNMEIVWLAFMIGYTSHLIMDSLTSEGIPLFFPIPFHFGIPPLKLLRIKTGGIVEKAIVFPALLLVNAYLFYNFYPIYLRLFQHLR